MKHTGTIPFHHSSLHILALFLLSTLLGVVQLDAQPTCDAHFLHYSTVAGDSVHFYPPQSNGAHAQFHWTFGDGFGSSNRDPWHRYLTIGTFIACLIVTDSTSGGTCTDTWCDTIQITAPPAPTCNAHFGFYALTPPDSIHFYAPQSNSAHARFQWDLGDGSTSTERYPRHRYSNYGVYYVCLTVTDTSAGGTCNDSWCDSIQVHAPAAPTCNAHFSHYATAAGDSVHFYPPQSNSTHAHFLWTFGDGSGSLNRDPWHQYSNYGTYIVCLTVTDTTLGGTCSDSWCDSIRVTAPAAPTCDAQFAHYSIAHADSVHFYPTASSNSAHAHYLWNFGDGGTSHEKYPWHHYANYGTYYVCLTVTDTTLGGTCSNTWCDSVHVTPPAPPTCDAHFLHYSMANPDSVHFYPPQSNATHAHFDWDFGDNSGSHNRDPWHLYATYGTYFVCLTVTDTTLGGTCSDTWCDTLIIPQHVVAYPNPASGLVSIAVAHGDRRVGIQIHDDHGNLIYQGEIDSPGSFSVHTGNLSSGVYFYQILDQGKVIGTGKFIVVKLH